MLSIQRSSLPISRLRFLHSERLLPLLFHGLLLSLSSGAILTACHTVTEESPDISPTPLPGETTTSSTEPPQSTPTPPRAPDIDVAPHSLELGDIEILNSATGTVTIANVGDAVLTLESIDLDNTTGVFALVFDGGSPPSALDPGQSTSITVTFSPIDPGPYQTTLRVASSDPDEPEVAVLCTGRGVAPDHDGDGFNSIDDCNDADSSTYPGAPEVCDGKDNDCDGAIDEGFPDQDGDGLPDCIDPCPLDPANDADDDGVCADKDVCPEVADDQKDTDGDGQGDACDPCPLDNPNDINGDGICGDGLPPDPSWVATPVDQTVATILAAATEFLYTGSDPVQTGVEEGTIDPTHVAVLRGRVLDREGVTLPGVTITILEHLEFGSTLSRADGLFDMAVNGGGYLIVRYEAQGLMPVQRQVNAPWQDYAWLPDVVMLPFDEQVSEIQLSAASIQVAQGSPVEDEDGVRQATVLFPPQTQATMTLQGGTTQPLTDLHVRATEYTVGDTGPQAMPGALPPNSAYTYAVELSVDEAVDAGASSVTFDKPLYFYLENFIGFPVGEIVPVGYYDRARGVWVPSDNGLVIEVVDVVGGLAAVDTDGDGVAESSSELDALGFSDAERQQLAGLYQPGQSLWRAPIKHFSSWDCNWGWGPPKDAGSCNACDPPSPAPEPDPDCQSGSIIDCQNQILGERVDIVGTPFSLHYSSDRVPGRKQYYTLDIRLSGSSVPASLSGIELLIDVAGQHIEKRFGPGTGQTYRFTWDGKDAYGRSVKGRQPVTVQIGYVYKGVYERVARFGSSGGGQYITGDRSTNEVTLWHTWNGTIGAGVAAAQGLGGWTIDVVNEYEPFGRKLHLGNGQTRSADAIGSVISTIAGTGSYGYSGDGISATEATLNYPAGVTVDANGNVFVADYANHRVRKVSPDGIIMTFAGNGQTGHSGDGGPATGAKLYWPIGVAIDAIGNVLIADFGNRDIRKVTADGIITTIAGNGAAGYSGDGGPATEAALNEPRCVAVDAVGNVYVADTVNHRIRKVSPDGIITTAVGSGSTGYGYGGFSGDGGPATDARLNLPAGVAIDGFGNLYIADSSNHRVRAVGADGIITTIAGSGQNGYSGDGGPATDAALDLPLYVAIDAVGSVYIADPDCDCVRVVSPDGIISIFAGNGHQGYNGDGGLATDVELDYPIGVTVDPLGNAYFADSHNFRIRKTSPALPGLTLADFAIPSEDGAELYFFNSSRHHHETRDALTNALRYQFTYDDAGLLTAITDGDGNVTAIERDPDGIHIDIVSPYGQRTRLELDGNGYLATITNPARETVGLTHSADGLLVNLVDPNGILTSDDPEDFVHTFQYDSLGRLELDQDPGGGSKGLERADESNEFTVTSTTAMGRATSFQTENLSTGGQHRINTFPAGDKVDQVITAGSRQTTYADGTIAKLTLGPDPRWGMQAPLVSNATLTTPKGRQVTVTSSRAVTLTDPTNQMSLQTQTDTYVVNGKTASSVYTASTRQSLLTSPAGHQRTITLDEKGRLHEARLLGQVPGPEGVGVDLLPAQFDYDPQGRLKTVTQGDRILTLNYYEDGSFQTGFLESVIDPMEHSVGYSSDAAGRVELETLPDDHDGARELHYGYDANGNRTSLTPPSQPQHQFTYTPVNLEADYIPPDVGAGQNLTHATYNLDQQLEDLTLPDGSIMDYVYHPTSGRLESITYPQGVIGFAYDPKTTQLETVTAADGGTLTFAYDGMLTTDDTWAGPVAGTIHRTFNNDLRVESDSINGAWSVAYVYDSDGLMTSAAGLTVQNDTDTGFLKGTTAGTVSDSFTYNEYGEGATYDAIAKDSILSIDYVTRDMLGRIVDKTEALEGESHAYHYTYTPAGRLEQVDMDGAAISHFTYDANGNRIACSGIGGTVLESDTVYDDQDRMLQYGTKEYTYTANGMLETRTDRATGKLTEYVYDAFGNLLSVTLPDGTVLEYVIDGLGRRIGKTANGALEQGFLYDGPLRVVAELDGNNQVVSRFVYGTRVNVPILMIRTGATYRIITDHLGSPRLVIDIATGAVAQRMDYDEWGKVLFDSNPGFQPFGFAGGLYDTDTGLVRFGARDYDAEVGRWTGKDPILFGGGDSNLYGYVLDDPINLSDPSGRWVVYAIAFGYGALDGYLTSLSDPCATGWDHVGQALVGGSVSVVGALLPLTRLGSAAYTVVTGIIFGSGAGEITGRASGDLIGSGVCLGLNGPERKLCEAIVGGNFSLGLGKLGGAADGTMGEGAKKKCCI